MLSEIPPGGDYIPRKCTSLSQAMPRGACKPRGYVPFSPKTYSASICKKLSVGRGDPYTRVGQIRRSRNENIRLEQIYAIKWGVRRRSYPYWFREFVHSHFEGLDKLISGAPLPIYNWPVYTQHTISYGVVHYTGCTGVGELLSALW